LGGPAACSLGPFFPYYLVNLSDPKVSMSLFKLHQSPPSMLPCNYPIMSRVQVLVVYLLQPISFRVFNYLLFFPPKIRYFDLFRFSPPRQSRARSFPSKDFPPPPQIPYPLPPPPNTHPRGNANSRPLHLLRSLFFFRN